MCSGSGSRARFQVGWSMLDARRWTTGSSSTPCCGCCARAHAGTICRTATASTRACTRASCAGARAGVWERLFDDLIADKKNQYLMIDSTIVRAHQQAAAGRKRGLRRPGSGAFPRWSEHQNPPDNRRGRTAGRLPHHARPGCGVCPGDRSARRPGGCRGDRRQRLRLSRDRSKDRKSRRGGRYPGTGSRSAATTANSTKNAIASNAASTASNTSAHSAQILPYPRSLPLLHCTRIHLAADCSYMSILS